MKEIKITCDKCKKDITRYSKYHVKINNDFNDISIYEFDFCESCYGDFIRTVGSWMKGAVRNDKRRKIQENI